MPQAMGRLHRSQPTMTSFWMKSVTTFTLDDMSWNRLMSLLDRPARVPVGLEELFSRPDVFADDARGGDPLSRGN